MDLIPLVESNIFLTPLYPVPVNISLPSIGPQSSVDEIKQWLELASNVAFNSTSIAKWST